MRKPLQIILILGVLGASLCLPACKHHPVLPEGPDPTDTTGTDTTGTGEVTCDSNIVYFQQQILPLFISNCALSGCHDAITHEKGLNFTTYEGIMEEVEPFDLDGGKLYEMITENDPDDVMPPPPRPRLSQEQIKLIATWIQQGAKNLSCTESACDSVNVSFSQHIQPLINSTCRGCHSGTNPSGGISFTSYDAIKTVALSGKLVNVISGIGPISMPPAPSPRVSHCNIAKIKSWVKAGAPNN